jgi:hypothetical protein
MIAAGRQIRFLYEHVRVAITGKPKARSALLADQAIAFLTQRTFAERTDE